MKRIRVILEIEYDPDVWYERDGIGAKDWFFYDVLDAANLSLHSNEPGDSVGDVVGVVVEDMNGVRLNPELRP